MNKFFYSIFLLTGFLFSQERVIPLDPFFPFQWGLANLGIVPFHENLEPKLSKFDADVDMTKAWAVETGSPDITLAVIDEWIDIDHYEFKGRIWENKNEIPGNGIDDDNNGYIDDVHGANINKSNGDIEKPPFLDLGLFFETNHGTMVASVAMANANNAVGIAGVDWNCKMMPIILNTNQFGVDKENYNEFKNIFEERLSKAIRYAADNGADVILFAEGLPNVPGDTPLIVEKAIEYAEEKGVVIVVSMGNFGSDRIRYPGYFSLNHNNLIAVGASNPDDNLVNRFWHANFITETILSDFIADEIGSAYGDYMDVIAPGNFVPVMSVQFDLFPYILGGTSFAAPIVAGICTLLKAQNPNRTPKEIKNIIRYSAEDLVGDPELDTPGFDKYHGYGRVNAYNALTNILREHNHNLVTPKISEIILFPNPAKNVIYIEKSNLQIGSKYFVFNSSGKILLEGVVSPLGNSSYGVNLSSLTTGVYWIQTTNAEGKFVSKQFQVN